MKVKRVKITRFYFLFLLITSIFCLHTFGIPVQKSNNRQYENSYFTNLHSSSQWILNNLTINGTATGLNAQNWSWAESQPWFGGGNGTKINPYRLENITIKNSESYINIYNSDVYFILKDCTLSNDSISETGFYPGIGIYLKNVSNGYIQNNNISQLLYGIYMFECSNNSIINNSLIRISHGIFIKSSGTMIISYNEITGPGHSPFLATYGFTGIYILNLPSVPRSYQDQIVLNNISKFDTAIRVQGANNCNISLNRIFNSSKGISMGLITESTTSNNIIYLIYEKAITISGPDHILEFNQIFTINGSGILLTGSENSLIQYNHIQLSNSSGIRLINSQFALVLNNTLRGNYNGISIEGSSQNNIFKNLIDQNDKYGILIDRYRVPYTSTYYTSSSNNVSLNVIKNNNNAGIHCYHNQGNVMMQNFIDNNSYGIYLSSFSRWNDVSKNTIINHIHSGILITNQSHYNDITENLINYNYCGINITDNSNNNDLTGNDLFHNTICYYIENNCDNTLLENNLCPSGDTFDPEWVFMLLIIGIPIVALIGVSVLYYKHKRT